VNAFVSHLFRSLVLVVVTCPASNRRTDGLQEDRYYIAEDEDEGIRPRLEPGYLLPKGVDQASQAEVDRCGDEGWSDSKAQEVPRKARGNN
jgi:hypothetical protein